MPKKRRATSRPELMARSVDIVSHAAHVGLRVDQRRGEGPSIESGPWLELRGRLADPVKGVSDVLVSVHPEDGREIGPARPAGIGAIIGLKPQMTVVVAMSHRDFDRLWALALSGRLAFGYLAFTTLRYGKARVVNASFSNEPD